MLSDDSEGEDIHELTINAHFAKAYEYRKEREELAKLKEKYGSDIDEDEADEEDSEEAESEDEDGEELTPAVDAAILRTLARIRRKDPSIYEQGKNVFDEEREKLGDAAPAKRIKKDKSKPITMRQHALASALNPDSRTPSPEPLTHADEQVALRQETIAAFHTAVDKEVDDDFLIPREKTKDEIEREEEEYRAFLEREVGDDLKEVVTLDVPGDAEMKVEEAAEEQQKKKRKKRKGEGQLKKSEAEGDQEFLMNYILNRGWIDHSARRLPTYKEITSKSKKGKGKAKEEFSDAQSDDESGSGSEGEGGADQMGELNEDEFDEVADRFESSYNFRFEEPDAATIARHPRNLPSLVRRQDSSRKEAREKRKTRKEEELLKKKEEVKRLKALKMKDIRAKLEMIGKEGGKSLEESKALRELDLDGDWDPEKHDQQMAELYEREADADAIDEEKPQWDDDIDVADIVPLEDEDEDEGKTKKSKKKKKKKHDESGMDEGGVDIDEMDAEVQKSYIGDDEEWDGSEEMRKRKLEEYMDELYGLEFNDMVGDMPTRFKYAKVPSQTYGLTPAEILMATDAELNSYVGIKKYAPYRKDGKGKQWDNTRTERLKELKDSLRDRGVMPNNAGSDARAEKVKKRKGRKERLRERAATTATNGETGEGDAVPDEGADAMHEKSGKKAKKAKDGHRDAEEEEDGAVGGENGESVKKRRRRHKRSGHHEDES